MKDMTDGRPKCLVEVRGKTLLDRQRDVLRGAGITQIGVVTGYKAEMLAGRGLDVFHNSRWAETNMVSLPSCASVWLEEAPCIVSYADISYDASGLGALMASAADLAVTFDPNWRVLWQRRFADPLADAETFCMTASGTLIEIGNRPSTLGEIEGQYMGLLRFTPAGLREMGRVRAGLPAAEQDRMHMTSTLQKIIAAGQVPVAAVPCTGEWGEVDSATDLAVYQTDSKT